ncbi:uncharacterized protein LOC121432252 [Lytechinus variegatus]|uniref:uncharacterized protein LOC121432252 n=1 Tax=Lytechinus variegatus TaxID=7654 RepID=UPI001BB21731|nr:uncharacterized protein LOC121432252 [Lytechinus variegatus]
MYHSSFGSDHAAVPRIGDNTLPFGLGLGAMGTKLSPPSTSSGPITTQDDIIHHTAPPHRQPMSPESASGEMILPEAPSANTVGRSLGGGVAGGPRTGLELGGQLVAGLPTPLERSLSTTTDMDPLESPSSRAAMGSVGCDEIAPSPGGMRDDPDAVILDDNGEEVKGKR